MTPYLAVFLHEAEAEAVCAAFVKAAQKFRTGEGEVEEEKDDGEDLCNVEFSLGYGGKILLNTATLHMKRGRRALGEARGEAGDLDSPTPPSSPPHCAGYGLVGPNGCGKSTLMRAIANGQVEGFRESMGGEPGRGLPLVNGRGGKYALMRAPPACARPQPRRTCSRRSTSSTTSRRTSPTSQCSTTSR